MPRNLHTSRGGKKNVAWGSPSESPGIIGRAVKKSENEKLDPDSDGIPATPASPDSTGKTDTTQQQNLNFSSPSSVSSKQSTLDIAKYDSLTDKFEQARYRIEMVFNLYQDKYDHREHVPLVVGFNGGVIDTMLIDFPPTDSFGDDEAKIYRINPLSNINADDGYFPYVLIVMMCNEDDLPPEYKTQIETMLPEVTFPDGSVSRFSGQLAEWLITCRQNCDAPCHPNMSRSTSPDEPASKAQLEELAILCRGYHATVHQILLTAAPNEKKVTDMHGSAENRKAQIDLDNQHEEMESSLAKALDPDVSFFKDDSKRQGLNITDEDVYKLGQKLDTARKFNGTRQSAQSIAYLTYGFLGSQLGCKTLQRIYSQGSSSEMPRNVTSSRKKYGSLDTQRSISSQQFNNSSLPTTNAIETMQAQVQFNRFCVYARNPAVSDDLNINDKDTDT